MKLGPGVVRGRGRDRVRVSAKSVTSGFTRLASILGRLSVSILTNMCVISAVPKGKVCWGWRRRRRGQG